MEFTSWLRRAAAEQLELEVVCAKTLAFKVLQQLFESGSKCVGVKQPEPIWDDFNLEVLVLAHITGLFEVNLDKESENSLTGHNLVFCIFVIYHVGILSACNLHTFKSKHSIT